jgi:hypothetical protein
MSLRKVIYKSYEEMVAKLNARYRAALPNTDEEASHVLQKLLNGAHIIPQTILRNIVIINVNIMLRNRQSCLTPVWKRKKKKKKKKKKKSIMLISFHGIS